MPGPEPPKGRGAVANPAGRFEPRSLEPVWDDLDPADLPPSPATTTFTDTARRILTRNESPDVPFDVSINPYRGCEHGCAYCFARPSHSYLNLSPGLDFETKIFVKPEAAALLARELAKPGYVCAPIALGTNTDPYQPVERERKITRAILEVLAAHRNPFSIVTKSALVLRDLDLIAAEAAERRASVFLSVTTLDAGLARRLEPRASAPHRRLEAVKALAAAGVPTGVLASPMIPALNDHELEAILDAAADAGASYANYILVRLPHEVKEVFSSWLAEHEPSRAAKILDRIRETRGGKLYDPKFGARMRGQGAYADLLARRFEIAARRHGFDRVRPGLDTGAFRVPGARKAQRGLFAEMNVAMREAKPS
ncbi:MAG TPA: PA0069 family radical SAM protein [Candidatus Polarisedimenticolaceae bacterium]|nr:PA0069 family radical SAM protein [Candidatus Polarisedimenticolaceae bacterium]